jgi:hypothetical protein
MILRCAVINVFEMLEVFSKDPCFFDQKWYNYSAVRNGPTAVANEEVR